MDSIQKLKLLVCVPPKMMVPGTIFYFFEFSKVIQDKIDKYIENPNNLQLVSTMEEYHAIAESERYSYDAILVQMGSIAPDVIDD